MKLLTSTFMASALILGAASMATAQDSMKEKATDMAVDKATDMAKDKAKDKATDMAGEKAGQMVEPAAKVGKHMMKGDSAKDAAMKVGKSEVKSMAKEKVMKDGVSMDSQDSITAGKVMMEGGSKEDAMMAVAKDKTKDVVMDKADSMMKKEMMQSGTVKSAPAMQKSYGSGTPAATTTAPVSAGSINCPSGTTAQANGTCMVTGDYQPRS